MAYQPIADPSCFGVKWTFQYLFSFLFIYLLANDDQSYPTHWLIVLIQLRLLSDAVFTLFSWSRLSLLYPIRFYDFNFWWHFKGEKIVWNDMGRQMMLNLILQTEFYVDYNSAYYLMSSLFLN